MYTPSSQVTKVLIVEDNNLYRNSVKLALEAAGFTVSEAENGLSGLTAAQKEHPDLIVLDVYMPVVNGLEMLDQLKKAPTLSTIPVIILTNVEEEVQNSQKHGAAEAYLKFNMSPIQVVDVCRKYLKKTTVPTSPQASQ